MKIKKSAMTESEWARYQSVAVTKSNLDDGVGLLVVVVLGVVGIGIILDISIPWIVAGLVALGIVLYKQVRSLIDGVSSYRTAKSKFKSNAVSTGATVGAGSAVMFANEYGNYVTGAPDVDFSTFEDIPVVDEVVEEMKGNRPKNGSGCIDNTPDDTIQPFEDIPTLEEALGTETIIDDGIDFGADSVVFDEDFIPQDPDM